MCMRCRCAVQADSAASRAVTKSCMTDVLPAGLNVFRNKSTRVRRHVHVHAWLTSTSMSQAELKDCRIFDEKHDTLLYVSYTTRNTGAADEGKVSAGRYKCAHVPVH